MHRMAVLLAIFFTSTVNALEAPQVVREFVKSQLDDTCRARLDWNIYTQPSNQSISAEDETTPLLYGRKIDSRDAIVVMMGAIKKCGLSGSAGSQLAVFIKIRNNRWHKAFDSGLAVRDHEWWRHKGKDRLLLGLHGSYCNGSGVDNCWSAQEIDGLDFKEVKRHPDYP